MFYLLRFAIIIVLLRYSICYRNSTVIRIYYCQAFSSAMSYMHQHQRFFNINIKNDRFKQNLRGSVTQSFACIDGVCCCMWMSSRIDIGIGIEPLNPLSNWILI